MVNGSLRFKRARKGNRIRGRFKSTVQHLKTVGNSPVGFAGAIIALVALRVVLDHTAVDTLGPVTGFVGTVTLSGFDDDDDKDDSDDGDGEDEDNGSLPRIGGTGIVYTRVSTDPQETDGHSLETQQETLERVADKHDINLPFDAICDKGETGTTFDRDGIERVLNLARRGTIDSLLVVNLSRIGREAPKTLCFIYLLQELWDVRVVTPSGPRNLSTAEDLMTTTLQALIDHLSAQNRTVQAIESTMRRFKEGNWSSAYNNVPFGYRPGEDNWVAPAEQMEDAVQDLFNQFLQTGSYTETGTYLTEEYGLNLPEDRSWKVKQLLQRGIYVGRPRMNIKSAKVDDDVAVVNDPDLQLVNEDVFERVQEKIERISEKYSPGTTKDVDDFIDEFELLSVFGSVPYLKLHCPECESPMKKNGQANLMGEVNVHRYRCTNDDCKREYKFPNERAYDEIKRLSDHLSDDEDRW
jgi:DNA invertase Pin-like site-specific DNA recombinase